MKITLTSGNILARYICIYAYQLIKDIQVYINIDYLYDFTLPCWDYIPPNERKKIKIICLSNGVYEIPYQNHNILLTIHYIENKPYFHHSELIKEIIIEYQKDDILLKFVDEAKRTVEDTMNREGRNLDTTIRKYIYDTSMNYPEWELINISKKRSLDTLFLPREMHAKIFNFVENFISTNTKSEYQSYGIPYKANLLFSGMPGSGKTTTIHCIASIINSDIGILSFTRNMDDIQFTKAINTMSKLENCRVLVLEDIDSLFTDERKQHDTVKNNISLSGILNCLDGLVRNEGIIICITTNRKDVLDEAVFRSGRVDIDIEFKNIEKDEIIKMVEYYYKDANLAEQFYDKIETYSLTTSDIQQYLFKYRQTPDKILKNYKELNKKEENKDKSPLYM
jgi:chaperone BCS1